MKQHRINLSNGDHVNIDIIRSCSMESFRHYFPVLEDRVVTCAPQLKKILKTMNSCSRIPINSIISDAVDMFGEMEDIESFFLLASNQRFNLTHQPISPIDINSASPLHSYTCVFRWFNFLICHQNLENINGLQLLSISRNQWYFFEN